MVDDTSNGSLWCAEANSKIQPSSLCYSSTEVGCACVGGGGVQVCVCVCDGTKLYFSLEPGRQMRNYLMAPSHKIRRQIRNDLVTTYHNISYLATLQRDHRAFLQDLSQTMVEPWLCDICEGVQGHQSTTAEPFIPLHSQLE